MVLQKLLQKLNCLLPGNVWAKVAVVAEQLVQPINSSRSSEAGSIVPEVLAVLPERHASPKQSSHLIPLEEDRQSSSKKPVVGLELYKRSLTWKRDDVKSLQQYNEK